MSVVQKFSHNGIVFADKIPGLGSAALSGRLKRALNGTRVGHTGTLDRFTSGLMILLCGQATAFADCFLKLRKRYRARFDFGTFTDTHDPLGTIIDQRDEKETLDYFRLHEDEIRSAIENFIHTKTQTPPAYSALKTGGRRYSDLARSGTARLPPERPATVYEIVILEMDRDHARVLIEIEVSSGVYIRSFARDLASSLEFPLHLGTLRRLKVGPYSLDEGHPIWHSEEEEKPIVMPILQTIDWPRIEVDAESARLIGHGRYIDSGEIGPEGENFFILGPEQVLLAWARWEKDSYRYKKVFSD